MKWWSLVLGVFIFVVQFFGFFLLKGFFLTFKKFLHANHGSPSLLSSHPAPIHSSERVRLPMESTKATLLSEAGPPPPISDAFCWWNQHQAGLSVNRIVPGPHSPHP